MLKIIIVGDIEYYSTNSAKEIGNQIRGKESEDIDLYVSSFGGDVMEANEISNILIAHKGKITITIGAVCASAAASLVAQIKSAQPETIIRAYQNAQIMIHNVWGNISGDRQTIEAYLKLMSNLQENIIKSYSIITGLPEEEIREMMMKETWMTAEEAKRIMFIDEIIGEIETEMPEPKSIENKYIKNMPENIKNKIKNNKKMDKNLKEQLGLPETATEEEVVEAIKTMKEKLELIEKEQEKLLKDKEKQEEEVLEAVIENAVKEGRIENGEREKWKTLMKKDKATTMELLKNRKLEKLSNMTNNRQTKNEDQDYDWYIKNNPEALNRMQKENPEEFKNIYNKKFKKQ